MTWPSGRGAVDGQEASDGRGSPCGVERIPWICLHDKRGDDGNGHGKDHGKKKDRDQAATIR